MAGAFLKPNGTTLYANTPALHVTAVYFLDSGAIGICQYPDAKSIVEKYLAWAKDCRASCMLTGLNWTVLVTSLSLRKSVTRRLLPSNFFATFAGKPHSGNLTGLTMPFCRISSTSASTRLCLSGCILLGGTNMDLSLVTSTWNSIRWVILGFFGLTAITFGNSANTPLTSVWKARSVDRLPPTSRTFVGVWFWLPPKTSESPSVDGLSKPRFQQGKICLCMNRILQWKICSSSFRFKRHVQDPDAGVAFPRHNGQFCGVIIPLETILSRDGIESRRVFHVIRHDGGLLPCRWMHLRQVQHRLLIHCTLAAGTRWFRVCRVRSWGRSRYTITLRFRRAT